MSNGKYVAQFAEQIGEHRSWKVIFQVTGEDFLSFLENVQILKQFGQLPSVKGGRFSNGWGILDGKLVRDVFALKKTEYLRIKNILKKPVPTIWDE